ncbi:hypothetical protein [Bradyrhizobium sp. LB11.1]|uniref:hypothetical protein n=1 Tax=Bradyrhizobium sp. LB11.1 TaxID=3156326 RepID=UPI00339A2EC3
MSEWRDGARTQIARPFWPAGIFFQHLSGMLDLVDVNVWCLRRPFVGHSAFDCAQDHEMLQRDGEPDRFLAAATSFVID